MPRRSKIDSSAMLLYEAPTGLAIFSFDGGCLNDPAENFWENLAPPSIEFFLQYERVNTPIDLANEAIDDHLAKKLTRLCGSEKKLAVGSDEHKRIIEMKLGITCLYVGVPDCEVINCSLKNHMRTLLAKEKSETNKDRPRIGKELIAVLCHHNIDVKPEMVNESIAELAHQLYDIKLREMELLKFFSILLKDFIVISGIDTKRWMLFQFATVPMMICCRGFSYEIYHPFKIFSPAEYRKIEANASRYKTSFSKIDVLSVYEDFVSLHSEKCILLFKLRYLVTKAKEVPEKAEVIVLPTGSKVGMEGSTNVDDSLNSIVEDNCSVVTLLKGHELDFSCERPQQDVKNILTILDEDPSIEKPKSNEEICNKQDDQCLIPDEVQEKLAADTDNVEENKQTGDTALQSMDDDQKKLTPNNKNEVVPDTRAMLKSGPLKVLTEETKSEEREVSTKSWVMSFMWQMSKRGASAARSPSADFSSPAKMSHEKTDKRSKARKPTCIMRLFCCYSVQCGFECACQDVSQE